MVYYLRLSYSILSRPVQLESEAILKPARQGGARLELREPTWPASKEIVASPYCSWRVLNLYRSVVKRL